MTNHDKPFSVREGFASHTFRMQSGRLMREIWAGIYSFLGVVGAMQVLRSVFLVHPSEVDGFLRDFNFKIQHFDGLPIQRQFYDEYLVNALRSVENAWMTAHKNGEWFRFYDMCEFLVAESSNGEEIAAAIRRTLDKMGNAGCQLVDGKFVPDLSCEEAEEVQMACAGTFTGAQGHMENAVAAFAARERPNYAHTVKEAVSAVESIVKELTGKEEMRSGLRQLAKDGILPKDRNPKGKAPFLVEALDGYWAYANKTSRHGLKSGESPPDADTARFLLVTCAAFVNYMTARKTRESDSSRESDSA